ncbi:prepilin-type N-terminal cleavage/methylation domain-containing protein [Patescibacteria group bacterium]|nr:prepilin-type N-terminal cleavage/methylation domain-containing protein [Patescibacteria group bacterium]MBU1501106.1 prepilin-type N-terminal cleavage/methylation domain-containing protein [Patescibacteria group bacterium]MBU2081021.1 prepilin-type N-terminal cleavage/methylation domain-containing protein [Patescibacteria group bacterium]MBU2124112.1 prepilin-type N-terminal cleavage/methylation domain-containing protein [Patescibacteria group bacterium]MBU2194968.1 prepilin-type N-terminal
MMTERLNSRQKGFTLIELLVVIAIIGLLSSVVLASLNTARVKSRDAKRIQDLTSIRTALELHFLDRGYYPQSGCGWDCNGYRYSYDSSWTTLAADLAPYIKQLPVDPLNAPGCGPWGNGCYTYAYGNVGRNTYPHQYDLTAQLEDPTSSHRCSVKGYLFYFNNQPWCGGYSGQIYEASR